MQTITTTSFGIVTRDESGTTVHGSNLSRPADNVHTLSEWADNVRWPGSGLARLESLTARFDTAGDLVHYDVTGNDDWVTSGEINAWTSECLVRAGYPSHPAIRSASTPVCMCPDDCNCHYSWRTNYCGCKGHAA